MKFLFKIAALIISNAIAIWVAAKIVPGITFEVTLVNLLKAGAVLGVVNSVIRPIVKLLSLPVIFLTLGAFIVIINVAMLMLVSGMFDFFTIHGFWAGLLGTIIISLVNYFISWFVKE